MIKHLIISGGGPLGLRFLGILKKLHEKEFWIPSNTESIYSTSVGSLIAVFVCLQFDWETLFTYLIKRPWQDAFPIDAKQIFDSYHNKGLFDQKFFEIILRPLFKAKGISLQVTLDEFYQHFPIDLHIFTFDLNVFQVVELTRQSYPQLELTKALAMSCALPGLFMPVIIGEQCFIDGGVMCNFPVNQCLRDHADPEEMLGIKMAYRGKTGKKNIQIDEQSTLLDYIVGFSMNAMNYIRDSVPMASIENTIYCHTNINPLQFEFIQEAITNKSLRQQWIFDGEQDAETFLTA